MSHLEQRLNQEISELESAVLRAEARAYGRVFNTVLPKDSGTCRDELTGRRLGEGSTPSIAPDSIKLRWWFAALLIGAAMWGGLILAVTR